MKAQILLTTLGISIMNTAFCLTPVTTLEQAQSLFIHSKEQITTRYENEVAQAEQILEQVYQVPADQRTFENTVAAYDRAYQIIYTLACLFELHSKVDPDKSLRETAKEYADKVWGEQSIRLFVDRRLYNALVEFNATEPATHLSSSRRHMLDEILKNMSNQGFDLPHNKFEQLKKLRVKEQELISSFGYAIAQDNRKIEASHRDLLGVPVELSRFEVSKNGKLLIGTDYPTYFPVMQNCRKEEVRKALYYAFCNRAHPENTQRLEELINVRDQIAFLLGYSSFADLSISQEMAGSFATAHSFISDLMDKVSETAKAEYRFLHDYLPSVIKLGKDGFIKPWDGAFVGNAYKKKYLKVDEEKIKEYFPLEPTIQGLFDLYQRFLGLRFEFVTPENVWHQDVRCIVVRRAGDNELLGHLFLDLHPRDGKYTHACHMGALRGCTRVGNGESTTVYPAVSIIIANLPKSSGDSPALLRHDDVLTFFHEFGHGLHAMLSRPELSMFSGTAVSRDYVECPSQMFEQWMWEPEILKMISGHYQTGEPLADKLIDSLVASKKFMASRWVFRQATMAMLALRCYMPGQNKDVKDICKQLHEQYLSECSTFDPENNYHASFGHLAGYGARYYAYMWSLMLAHDVFSLIKEHGLMNEEIGQRFAQSILAPGGSRAPHELVAEFLGREPNNEAFLANLGT